MDGCVYVFCLLIPLLRGEIVYKTLTKSRSTQEMKIGCIEEEEVSKRFSIEIGLCNESSEEEEGLDDDDESESLFSLDMNGRNEEEEEEEGYDDDVEDDGGGDNNNNKVYVAVGKSDESSLYALGWTLQHSVGPSTLVYLLHVFPQIRYIPTPLGKMPRNQVNPEQVEKHLNKERSKRRQHLQRYLDICAALKVKAETMLIEGDAVAEAILDHIPSLSIRKLVMGTSNASLRKLMRSKRACGVADQVLENAPDSCEVVMICEGQQVAFDQMILMQCPYPPRGTPGTPPRSPLAWYHQQQQPQRSSGSHSWKWLSPFHYLHFHRRHSTSSGDSSVGRASD